MHNYSRNMPPAPDRRSGVLGWMVLLGLGGGLLYVLSRFPIPILLFLCGGFVLLCVYAAYNTRRHIRRMAVGREGESTCTFARSFDYRNMDTWIIRAVYEELQPYCTSGQHSFPLRATDRLEEDLGVDSEDLVFDILPDIAHRTGRLLVYTNQNPFNGKVVTVRDLVMYLSHQPRKEAAAQEAIS
jgi:hypothetical protein